ncbi:hypothetical protein RUM44_008580 [Polyplax serrata]|uniref:Uncharacterized protein n=1 Tax=Polyplax serrata TaxID=468196 RepID=A0ABR1BCP3_POLSC
MNEMKCQLDYVTFTTFKETIWNVRMEHLEKWILSNWTAFTIWNAGKQGRRFFRSLKPSNRKKVVQFCDVDPKKTDKFYEPYLKSGPKESRRIPIVHFTKASPPFVTCVKLGLTHGQFEENLKSLNLVEGRDFYVFS